jgi:hypothetical protein
MAIQCPGQESEQHVRYKSQDADEVQYRNGYSNPSSLAAEYPSRQERHHRRATQNPGGTNLGVCRLTEDHPTRLDSATDWRAASPLYPRSIAATTVRRPRH